MFQLQQVDKFFPGVHALKSVDFEIKRDEIVGLVGENGAGKSTLMKVIYGAYQHDSGKVLVNGTEVKFSSPRQAMDMGVGMVFQEQSLIPNLTVMENIFLGFEQQFVHFGIINWKAMSEAARYQLAKVKLDINPALTTSQLSFVQRQLVEMAKVLTLEERIEGDLVILLDEPTSVLAKDEIKLLFELVRDLRSRASFIFVSHRLDEVVELSDRIYVLKDGEVVDNVESGNFDVDAIQQKMVGRVVSHEYYCEERQKPFDSSTVLLETNKIGLPPKFQDISLTLHPGEVLCLVGAEGAGRESIIRTIFGLESPIEGTLTIAGEQINSYSARNGVDSGVAYLPRERKLEGIIEGMNVFENLTLSQLLAYSSNGVLEIKREKRTARDWISELSIKASTEQDDCGTLSGGNQQKVVLAKWRSGGAKIMLLDHPTRGLDIGAKEDVYKMIRDMSDAGIGIILIADTLEEAIGLSHTIAVIKDGKIQQWFPYNPEQKPSQFDLIHHMI